jgi:hypothetical protein
MGSAESSSLRHRLEPPHPPLSCSGILVRLFGTVVGMLIGDMDGFRNHFSMNHRVTSQLIRNDLPEFTTMAP